VDDKKVESSVVLKADRSAAVMVDVLVGPWAGVKVAQKAASLANAKVDV